MKVASVDTGNEKRDGHLQSADFFEAEKNPTLTFKSTKVEKGDKGYNPVSFSGRLPAPDRERLMSLLAPLGAGRRPHEGGLGHEQRKPGRRQVLQGL